jgi:predicted CopG family antitoxin
MCSFPDRQGRLWVEKLNLPGVLIGSDRKKKLDCVDSLYSRLIKLMTSVALENVKHSVSELIFELLDQQGKVMDFLRRHDNTKSNLKKKKHRNWWLTSVMVTLQVSYSSVVY